MSRRFLDLARRSLAAVGPEDARAYLEQLDARLAWLSEVAAGRPTVDRVRDEVVDRVVSAIEADWHDGDENLVRGFVDRWRTAGDATAAARLLLEAVAAIETIEPPAGTLRFLLWEMESVIAGLEPEATGVGPVSAPRARLLESPPQQPTHSRREVAMPKRILVVDDDENILSLERTILEQKGYVVTTAGGGEEALQVLREQAFDLLLLDVMMPDKDGFEVCRQLKQDARTRDLPVIFLTAKGGGEALAEGFESGAVMYINKPFTANKLLTIVNTMLEQTGR